MEHSGYNHTNIVIITMLHSQVWRIETVLAIPLCYDLILPSVSIKGVIDPNHYSD